LPWIGDIAVPTDYTGDGKADLAVFRPLDGFWYIKNISDDSITTQQWGTFGDIPIQGHDVNGDGVKDLLVYRASNSTWFYNLRNGSHKISQYGFSSDSIPFKVSRN
jgi:hypothetical protein